MTAHATIHRLRFNDTDQLGHVNNAVFVVMLEQGRAEMTREAGLPATSEHHAMVIVRLELDFVAEMHWPGDVTIETSVLRLGGRSFTMQQRLLSGGAECARAQTVMVVMDRATRRSVPIDPWRECLSAYLVPPPA